MKEFLPFSGSDWLAVRAMAVGVTLRKRRVANQWEKRGASERVAHLDTAPGARPSGRFHARAIWTKRLACGFRMMKRRKRRAPANLAFGGSPDAPLRQAGGRKTVQVDGSG